ncbi:hypothetical protein KI387_032721, partial [Taxus chinensis]
SWCGKQYIMVIKTVLKPCLLLIGLFPMHKGICTKMHPDVYFALKDTTFNKQSNQLCVSVVEKLFYRQTLQGCHSVSNKMHACSCLIEGNTLYVSQEAEYSAMYLELSRLFFMGCVNLQLANFLHLITIMAQSGSTEEQTESFMKNKQEIPELPQEETRWFCEHRDQSDTHAILSSSSIPESNLSTEKSQKICVDASWPPTTWFGAPRSRVEVQPHGAISEVNQDAEGSYHNFGIERVPITIHGSDSDQIVDSLTDSTDSEVPHDLKNESDSDIKKIKSRNESTIASKDDGFPGSSLARLENTDVGIHSQKMSASDEMDAITSSIFSKRNKLCSGVPDDEQRQLTGRLGEHFVYKYLLEKYGPTSVNWVNEKYETGSPYDMIVSKENGKKEFIEVKATRSEKKDWFEMTNQEWEFARKNSSCFTIIRAFLTSSRSVKFVMLENPMKLCQQKFIKLVVLTPTTHHFVLPEVTFMPQGWDEVEASYIDKDL